MTVGCRHAGAAVAAGQVLLSILFLVLALVACGAVVAVNLFLMLGFADAASVARLWAWAALVGGTANVVDAIRSAADPTPRALGLNLLASGF